MRLRTVLVARSSIASLPDESMAPQSRQVPAYRSVIRLSSGPSSSVTTRPYHHRRIRPSRACNWRGSSCVVGGGVSPSDGSPQGLGLQAADSDVGRTVCRSAWFPRLKGAPMPACTKRRYRTALAAGLVLRRMMSVHPERGEKGIHPCQRCHAFHLTSAPSAARNRWAMAAIAALAR